MRNWLVAKAEEDRRKQEEERTQQETLRLEQRRLEHEILRTSLAGGIPPPMVPIVFAGMGGGTLPQTALDWAQQFMASQAPGHSAMVAPSAGGTQERRRDSQGQPYSQYQASVPSTPGGTAQHPSATYQFPASPTRGRGHTVSTMPPGGSRPLGPIPNLPHLNTNIQQQPPHHQPSGPSHPQTQAHSEAQASPIYFHHWQPPNTQGESSGGGPAQPPAASGSSKPKRKLTLG